MIDSDIYIFVSDKYCWC